MELPGCAARIVTVPAVPVSDTVAPLIVAGPLATEKLTGSPLLAVAATAKEGSLVSRLGSGANVIDCGAPLIVIVNH